MMAMMPKQNRTQGTSKMAEHNEQRRRQYIGDSVLELNYREAYTPTFKTACGIVLLAQVDLGRHLTPGERRDLLKDNTDWDSSIIAAVVNMMGMN